MVTSFIPVWYPTYILYCERCVQKAGGFPLQLLKILPELLSKHRWSCWTVQSNVFKDDSARLSTHDNERWWSALPVDLSPRDRRLRPLRQEKQTSPLEFQLAVQSAQPPKAFSVVFKNNMDMHFVYIGTWTTCWPVKGGVLIQGSWLARLICQSEGGKRSILHKI